MRVKELRRDFGIPESLNPTAVISFGYPTRKIIRRKSRLPLYDIAFFESYGTPVDPDGLSA